MSFEVICRWVLIILVLGFLIPSLTVATKMRLNDTRYEIGDTQWGLVAGRRSK